MGLFSKFHTPEGVPSDYRSRSPSVMTEMTDYSTRSHSRGDSNSERLLSSAASIVSTSTFASTQGSVYSSRKSMKKGWVHDINKHSLMAKHLFRNCKKNNWVEDKASEACVALRTFQGEYILHPPEDRDESYEKAVRGLNVEVFFSY
jgi:hypothetical protein